MTALVYRLMVSLFRPKCRRVQPGSVTEGRCVGQTEAEPDFQGSFVGLPVTVLPLCAAHF